MRVLLTGGAGLIGSHTAEALIECQHEVLVLDNFSTGREEWLPPGCMYYHGDITDAGMVGGIFDDFKPEVVCHLAAQASASKSWYSPRGDLNDNANGTLVLLEIGANRNLKHFVYASSAAVYGQPAAQVPDPTIPETCRMQPTCPYGVSKAAAESYVRLLAPSFTILRYSNVYGPRQAPLGDNQVIPKCIAHCRSPHPPFKIRGDGQQLRDFIYVEDVAIANLLAVEVQPKGIYNVSTGKGTSVQIVCDIIAHDMEFVGSFQHEEALPYEPRDLVLDPRRFMNATGWKATMAIREGIERTVDWHAG